MLEKLKKSLDDAFQGIKTGTSKVTLKAEEKTKLTRLNLKVNALKKEMDGMMIGLGNQLYTFREEQRPGRVFEDGDISRVLEEADRIKGDMVNLQREMEQLKEDYEMRIQSLELPEDTETKAREASEKKSA